MASSSESKTICCSVAKGLDFLFFLIKRLKNIHWVIILQENIDEWNLKCKSWAFKTFCLLTNVEMTYLYSLLALSKMSGINMCLHVSVHSLWIYSQQPVSSGWRKGRKRGNRQLGSVWSQHLPGSISQNTTLLHLNVPKTAHTSTFTNVLHRLYNDNIYISASLS